VWPHGRTRGSVNTLVQMEHSVISASSLLQAILLRIVLPLTRDNYRQARGSYGNVNKLKLGIPYQKRKRNRTKPLLALLLSEFITKIISQSVSLITIVASVSVPIKVYTEEDVSPQCKSHSHKTL